MYQGLHPRTRLLRWALFLGAIGIVVWGTSGAAIDAVSTWLRDEYDRLPWYVTRTTALLSYLALTGSMVYGLLLSTKILDRIAHRAVSYTLHQDLSSIGLALALAHAAVLMIDRSVPYSPLEVLVPFGGPYRPLWVGIGQITLGISLIVLLSFYVRRRIGQPRWRQLHYLGFVAFVGATVHGLMAGTDTQATWVFLGYLLMSSIVAFLLTYRVVLAVQARRAKSSPPSTPATSPGALGPLVPPVAATSAGSLAARPGLAALGGPTVPPGRRGSAGPAAAPMAPLPVMAPLATRPPLPGRPTASPLWLAQALPPPPPAPGEAGASTR